MSVRPSPKPAVVLKSALSFFASRRAGLSKYQIAVVKGVFFACWGLTAQVLAGGPSPANPKLTIRPTAQSTLPVSRIGIQLVPKPVRVAPGVFFVAKGANPAAIVAYRECNLNAADTTNADQLWPGGGLGLNLNGNGLVVGIWDGGSVRSSHQELNGRASIIDAVSLSDHSTHVAGTIGATGVSPSARGMASGLTLRSRDFNSDKTEMAADASLIQLSNHSYSNIRGWTQGLDWGIGPVDTWFADRFLYSTEDPGFGKYTSNAQQLDQILANNPSLLSVWSASNDRGEGYLNSHGTNQYVTYFSGNPGGIGWTTPGYYLVSNVGNTAAPPSDGNAGSGFDSLPGDQTSKNSLVVGAVNDLTADPYNNADVVIASFSSTGPVDDGRIKPDVVGNGTGLFSCIASSDSSYATFSGTSMSSPNVCGTAALLVQHYRNLHSGLQPSSATIKGLLIHTSSDAGTLGPDYTYGWGLANAAAAVLFLNDSESGSPNLNHRIQGSYSGTPQDNVFVSSGGQPLRATLVWTDPPGNLPGSSVDDSTKSLINDLDLLVIGPPAATTYRPWTLDRTNPSNPATRTVRNSVDNVEQVLIDAPTPGSFTVRVNHSGTVLNQAYSLFVSGATRDTIAPTVTSISAPSISLTRIGPVSYTVNFSESVLGFDSSADIQLNKTGTANAASVTVTGSGSGPYAVTLSSITGDGTIGITVKANACADAAGNGNTVSSPSSPFTVDNTSPAIMSISGPSISLTRIGPVSYTVNFSESVLGFDSSADIQLNKTGTANAGSVTVTGSGSGPYTVTLSSITGDGTIGITVKANACADAAGNGNTVSSASTTFTADNTPPTLVIGPPSVSQTCTGPVDYAITYVGADTVSLTPGSVTMNTSGSAIGSISVLDGTTFGPTVRLSNLSGAGSVGISIAGGTAMDAAGNLAGTAGPSTTFSVLAVPVLPSEVAASDGIYCDKINLTWTLSPGADNYEIWRNTIDNQNTATLIGSSPTNSYVDTTAIPNTNYFYFVRAINTCGDSGFSASDAGRVMVKFR